MHMEGLGKCNIFLPEESHWYSMGKLLIGLKSYHIYLSVMLPLGTKGNIDQFSRKYRSDKTINLFSYYNKYWSQMVPRALMKKSKYETYCQYVNKTKGHYNRMNKD